MITYVLTLSKTFPSAHPKKGEPTFFRSKVMAVVFKDVTWKKYHTIRSNYDLWKKRFEKIADGEACLSIRQWTGKPYASKQVEITRLTKEDGIGIQKLEIVKGKYNSRPHWWGYVDGKTRYGEAFFPILAENDGLSAEDWLAWFRNYDLSKPLAIIHFTKFRY